MLLKNHILNQRNYSSVFSIEEELSLTHDKNYLFDLSFLSSVSVKGEQATNFLQGQLSCDMRQVTPTTFRQAAMCNLKGRVLALLDVIDWQNLQIILPEDLIADSLNSLNKTALLSRVKFDDVGKFKIYGFYLANPHDLLPNIVALPTEAYSLTSNIDAACYKLTKNRYIILVEENRSADLLEPFTIRQQIRGSLAWHLLELQNKMIQIYPQTRGLFLPHRLDLHLSNHLNFDKGCYKGQEIVARTHYRAKLKHSLKIYQIYTIEQFEVGRKLFDSTGKIEIGEIIDFSPLSIENQYLLAVSIMSNYEGLVLIEQHVNPIQLKIYC